MIIYLVLSSSSKVESNGMSASKRWNKGIRYIEKRAVQEYAKPSDGYFYASKPSSSQEKNNPNPFFKKKKFGLYQYGGVYKHGLVVSLSM